MVFNQIWRQLYQQRGVYDAGFKWVMWGQMDAEL
jgi:hypothetical protein